MSTDRARYRPAREQELAVDAGFEEAVGLVEVSVDTYLDGPARGDRAGLVAALQRLDERIAESSAYEGSVMGSGALGMTDKFSTIGGTGAGALTEDVPAGELRLQADLVAGGP